MMSANFWKGLADKVGVKIDGIGAPLVKMASAAKAVDLIEVPDRIPLREAKSAGFFRLAGNMGWGLYRVEDIDGGLGSIWSIEKDAETGGQFLVKQTDPAGEIMRMKLASATRVASAPPGKKKEVEELKKKPGVENPFAVAWSQYDKEKKAAGTHTKCVKCEAQGETAKMEKNVHGAGFLCAGCAKEWNKDSEVGGHYKKEAAGLPAQPGSDLPPGVSGVYDNGGATADRYTVYYDDGTYVGMSADPFHPQGFGQHGEGSGPAPEDAEQQAGKPIAFSALPPDCQKLVMQDLEGGEHGAVDPHMTEHGIGPKPNVASSGRLAARSEFQSAVAASDVRI